MMVSSRDRKKYEELKKQWTKLKKSQCREFIKQISNLIDSILQTNYVHDSYKRHANAIVHELEVLKTKARKKLNGKSVKKKFHLKIIESAFANRILNLCVVNYFYKDINKFFNGIETKIIQKIESLINGLKTVKIYAMLTALFATSRGEENILYLYTKINHLFPSSNLKSWYVTSIKEQMLSRISEFDEGPSNLTLKEIISLSFYIQKTQIVRGGTYIPTPAFLRGKIVNVKNNDEFCFLHTINSFLKKKKPLDELNLDIRNLSFPLKLKDVAKFEKKNRFSVNVLGIKKQEIFIYHRTKNYKGKSNHINMLLLEEGTKKHYTLVRNLSRLCCSQLRNKKIAKFFCEMCLNYFLTEKKLQLHLPNCLKFNDVIVNFPTKKFISFENFHKQKKIPFIIFADSECVLSPVSSRILKGAVNQHEVHSIGFYLHSDHPRLIQSEYFFKRGENVAKWFAQRLKDIAYQVDDILKNVDEALCLSRQQQENFNESECCYLCNEPFSLEDWKVRDHDHLSGEFLGPCHNSCNLKAQKQYVLPCVFQNLMKYDMHLIIRDLAKEFNGRIDVIAKNSETYVGVIIWLGRVKLTFIDSYKFLPGKLETLANYLPIEKKQLLRKFSESDDQFQMMIRKGFFPYEYLTDINKLEEPRLPPIEAFFSSLSGETISMENYEHVQKMWTIFRMKTLGDLSDVYLKIDVLLLCCVFQTFRESCLENYSLDPAHYFTLPGLSWDSFLKFSKTKLEIIKDIDIYNFFENIRGGFTSCVKRFCSSNCIHQRDYNPMEPIRTIFYLDRVSLYAGILSQALPYKDFRWVEDIDNFDIFQQNDPNIGYVLEVDVDIPEALHDKFKDYPLLPDHEIPPGKKDKKLLATLYNKKNYVVHIENLKFAIRHGLTLRKIHRVLSFRQKPFLKGFIDLNVRLRAAATNDFDKNLYKLMSNSIFGRSIINKRNFIDFKLINSWKKASLVIAKDQFLRCVIFEENLVGFHMRKPSIVLDNPVYIGFCVLDLAKLSMQEFHYDVIQPSLKANLLYTDTDSFLYEIEDDDPYRFMRENIELFDTSDYPENNRFDMPRVNKKVPLKMSEELKGVIILRFVGLRAKLYALETEEDAYKKAKGVKSNVLERDITFSDYYDSLMNERTVSVDQVNIRTKNHLLYTVSNKKIALDPFDDKRYIIPNSVCTLPWGHKDIQ